MTDEFLPCRTETEDSASLFHELKRRAEATPGGRHAALALDTLGELMTSKTPDETPALTSSTLEPLVVPLGDLAHGYDGKCWRNLVLTLLDLVPVPARKPALVLQLALYAPADVRPVLLAEYWHLLMIGARHDRLFVLTVALDVWGHALSTPCSCLAETLVAAANRAPEGSPWLVPTTNPLERSARSAFRALRSMPGEFDFVRGWCLVHLSPWLKEAGLGAEILRWAEGLSNRFGARDDTLQRLAMETPRPVQDTEKLDQSLGENTVHRLCVAGADKTAEKKLSVYLKRPAQGYHPLHFQNAWFQAQYGVAIEPDIMTELQAL